MEFFVFLAVIAVAVFISLLSRKGVVPNSINDVLVASGSFGPALLFFIMVGENYTTGTLLGAPGSIYSKGASYGFWFISYILLAYSISYFLSPAIWRLGRLSQGATVGDILSWRFDSKLVEVAIAICSMIFLVPTIQIQLTGLGLVLKYLNLGLSFETGVLIAILMAFVMIMISGIRAPAYVSILKDFLLLLSIIIIGAVCIMKMDGGLAAIFQSVYKKMPHLLSVPDNPPSAGLTFTMSTIFFQMLVLNLYPILVAGTLTSASETNIRKSVVIMPLYMMMFPLLVVSAYFALIALPPIDSPDAAMLALAKTYLPAWLLGLIAGGIALTGILVISVNALSIGGLFAKNLMKVIKPDVSQNDMIRAVKIVSAVALLAGGFVALFFPTLLATILTISYSGMAQIMVAFCFAFFWKKGNPQGIVAGMAAGLLFLTFYSGDIPFALNKGFCAVLINAVIAIAVSSFCQPSLKAIDRYEKYQSITPWTKV